MYWRSIIHRASPDNVAMSSNTFIPEHRWEMPRLGNLISTDQTLYSHRFRQYASTFARHCRTSQSFRAEAGGICRPKSALAFNYTNLELRIGYIAFVNSGIANSI